MRTAKIGSDVRLKNPTKRALILNCCVVIELTKKKTTCTITSASVFFPAIILYFSCAGRIKQRILCSRKFIIMFGSSDLFIEQLLALAECRLLKFSFRAWQKYCILSLLSLDRFSEGILINISSKKNAFVRVFTPTIRHFETGLFKKSGKIR